MKRLNSSQNYSPTGRLTSGQPHRQKERTMTSIQMKTSLSSIFYLALVLLFAGAASANVNTPFPDANPGPPFYAFLDRPPQGEIFQDGAWAAIVWVRNPACVPADFNLLD